MFRKLLLSGIAAVCATSQALAADAVEPAVYDWTGAYVGAHAGYSWSKTTASETPENGVWNVRGDSFTADVDGFLGGLQAGYNYQIDSWVLGAELDIGYLDINGDAPTRHSIGVPFDTIVSTDGGGYATARLRGGYALDRLLIFATGGLIYANLGSEVNDSVASQLHTDETRGQFGWTLGGGLEYALTDAWSVKVDYLYYELNKENVVGQPPSATQDFDIDGRGHIFRGGVNWHF